MSPSHDDVSRDDPRLNEILAKYLQAAESGEPIDREQIIQTHPEYADELREFFADKSQIDKLAGDAVGKGSIDEPTLPPDSVTRLDVPTLASSASVTVAPRPGTIVRYFGDYELLEEIARGGMGVVYKARQVKLNRIVALKMILSGQFASKEDVQRFYTEAEAAAGLDHRGIVPIIEVGDHEGQHFFSMGYVEGESLASRLADGPLPPREAAELVRKVAESVQYAHERGVIHRDLKPANVLLNGSRALRVESREHQRPASGSQLSALNSQPMVTDFGLAKKLEGDSNLTGTGQILGTPSYMPPEQAAGRVSEVREAADVYSLGAILYATLTGRPPFQADNPLDTLMQVLEREPVAPRQLNPAVPRDLETICLKCLEKDPRRRYDTATALVEELARFLEGRPILARPAGPVERGWRWCRRNPRIAAMSAALVVVLMVATVVSASFAFSENAAKRQAVDARKAESEQKELALLREAEAKAARNSEAEQRRLAEEREAEAISARQQEAEQRQLAEQNAAEARWNTYVARMQTLRPVWERGEFGQLEVLLDQYEPKEGEPDFRGWEWRYLRDQCRANIRVLDSKTSTRYVAWRPDGQRLAVRRSNDAAVLIWDTDAGTIERTLPGKGNMPIAWSPDGRFLAAGRGESDLDIWDTATGEQVRQIHCNLKRTDLRNTLGLGWSHNGELLAYGGDGFLEILTSEGAPQRQFRVGRTVDENWIRAIDWHPTDMRLGVVDHDGFAYAFNGLTGEQLWRTEVCNIDCCDVAWRPDGKRLACSARYPVFSAKVFDEEGQLVATLPRVSGPISWSPDGERLAAIGPSQFIHIWHVESGEGREMHVHKGGISAVAWRPGSEEVFTAGGDGTLKLWNASTTHQPALAIHADPGVVRKGSAPRISVAWSPDGSRVITGGSSGRVATWNAADGALEAELAAPAESGARVGVTNWPVHVVAWHPEGQMVAAITEDGAINLWDATTQQKMKTLQAGSRSIDFQYLRWSSDGKRLLCDVAEVPLGQLKPVYYWEDAGLGERRQLTTSDRNSMSWHPDGKHVAIQRNRQLELWSVPEHRLVRTIKTMSSAAFIWEPQGRILALGEGGLQFFNAHSGEAVATSKLHAGSAFGAWSPAGERIVTAGTEDTALKIVDAATGDEVFTLSTGGAPFTDVAFSPDGRRIATADSAGFVRIWGSPNIDPPGDYDFLATGVLAKVRSPDEEMQAVVASIQRRSAEIPGRALDEQGTALEVLQAAGTELLVDGHWMAAGDVPTDSEAAISGVRVTTAYYLTPTLLRQVAALETVERLEIGAAGLDASRLGDLSQLPSLRELVLSGISVDSAVAEQLASLSSLRRVDLHDATIIDKGAAAALAGIDVLHSLSLSGLAVTDSDAELLLAIEQLKELRLTGTSVTADMAVRLRQQLSKTNVVYDDFRQDREAAEWVLKVGGTIHILEDNKRHAVSQAADLPAHPFRLAGVLLIDSASVGDQDLERLRDLPMLHNLNLSGTGIADEGLAHVQSLTELQFLYLNRTRLNGTGLAHLERLENLVSLSAAATPFTSDGLSRLPPLAGLETLMIQSTELSDGYLEYVCRLPALKNLHVWTGNVNPGLEHLKGMTLLKLSLHWQQDLPDDSVAHLATLPNLQELDLTGSTYVTADGFRHLAQVKSLQTLIVAKTQFDDQAAEAIATLPRLTRLDATETKLTSAGVMLLKPKLPECEIVTTSK
ncbi:MAG: protein kinase [Planctomycetota bacterium]|nr:protein kinase [Planctomycetota bacterium]